MKYPVLFVRCICVARNSWCLYNSLWKSDSRIWNSHLNVTVKLPYIVQNAVQMHLSIPDKNMLSRLFNFGLQHQVTFVCSSNGFYHFGQLTGDQWFDGYSNSGLGPKFQRTYDIYFHSLRQICVGYGCCFGDGLINTFNENEISSSERIDFNAISSLKQIYFSSISDEKILFISWDIVLSHDSESVSFLDGSRENSSKNIEGFIIFCVIHFDSIDEKRPICCSFFNWVKKLAGLTSVMLPHNPFCSFEGYGNVLDDTLGDALRSSKIFFHDEFYQGFYVQQILIWV